MTDDTSAPSEFIDVAEIATRLGLSKMTVYRLIHSGEIPALRVGRTFRVPRAAYEAKFSAAAVATAPAAVTTIPGQTEIPE